MLKLRYKLYFAIIVMLIAMITSSCQQKKNTISQTKIDYSKITMSIGSAIEHGEHDILEQQDKIAADLIKDYSTHEYNFNSPFIKIDPYNINPLSALLMFKTKEPCKISITVKGAYPIKADFTDYEISHNIPILGLYANRENIVEIVAHYKNGTNNTKIIKIKTNNSGFDSSKYKISLVKSSPSKMQPGLTFFYSNYPTQREVFAIDPNGEIRYSMNNSLLINQKLLSNNKILSTTSFNNRKRKHFSFAEATSAGLIQSDILGRIDKYYKVPLGITHDFTALPNNNILVLSEDSSSKYEGDVVLELDKNNGKVINSYDLKNMLDINRIGFLDNENNNFDWFHANSVFYDAKNDLIIVSGRHQGIVAFNKTTKKLKWILSDNANWSKKLQPYLLRAKNSKSTPTYGQHLATINDSGRLMAYDDGNFRSLDKGNYIPAYKNYSRGVEYKIDTKAMTYEQTWEFGKQLGSSTFTMYVGAIYQDKKTKNHLITFGGIVKDSYGAAKDDFILNGLPSSSIRASIIEVDKKNNIVFRTNITGLNIYRSARRTLYPENIKESDLLINNKAIQYNDDSYIKDIRHINVDNLIHGIKIPVVVDNQTDETLTSNNYLVSYQICDNKGNVIDLVKNTFYGLKIDNLKPKTKENFVFVIKQDELPKMNGEYQIKFDILKIPQRGVMQIQGGNQVVNRDNIKAIMNNFKYQWLSSAGMKILNIKLSIK